MKPKEETFGENYVVNSEDSAIANDLNIEQVKNCCSARELDTYLEPIVQKHLPNLNLSHKIAFLFDLFVSLVDYWNKNCKIRDIKGINFIYNTCFIYFSHMFDEKVSEDSEKEIQTIYSVLEKSITAKRNKSNKKSATNVSNQQDNHLHCLLEYIFKHIISPSNLNFIKICYQKTAKTQTSDAKLNQINMDRYCNMIKPLKYSMPVKCYEILSRIYKNKGQQKMNDDLLFQQFESDVKKYVIYISQFSKVELREIVIKMISEIFDSSSLQSLDKIQKDEIEYVE